jgi:membrane fusion protein, heavy metal efflux system
MNKVNNIRGIVFLAFSIIIFSCSKKTESENAEKVVNESQVGLTASQLKNAEIELGKIAGKEISSVIKLNGKIDVPPQNMVSVSAPMGGYLKSTKLLPGMHLKKGEIIAVLEDPQYIQLQQDYLLAKSKLNFAEMEYARQLELNKSQASSDKVTQMAQNEVNNQKIMMNALAEKLKIININPSHLSVDRISKSIFIYSAINGFVSKVNVNIGKYVNPSDVLFELIDPSDIHLNLKVYEKDIDKLVIGQKLLAYSNANPETKYNCEIILISHDINAEGIAEVHCHFEGHHTTLAPGMYMNAEIEVKSNSTQAINEEAIVNFEGKNYVFAQAENNNFEMTQVTLGVKENGFVEILNSKALQNKNIAIKGAYTLLMKLKNKSE